MARKSRTSPLEDMLSLVALMPWWVGVAIAAIGYVVLHRMAAPVQVTAVQPGQVSHLITQTVISGLATAGQYIVPLVGLVGAAMSFFRRKQRAALVTDVAQALGIAAQEHGLCWVSVPSRRPWCPADRPHGAAGDPPTSYVFPEGQRPFDGGSRNLRWRHHGGRPCRQTPPWAHRRRSRRWRLHCQTALPARRPRQTSGRKRHVS